MAYIFVIIDALTPAKASVKRNEEFFYNEILHEESNTKVSTAAKINPRGLQTNERKSSMILFEVIA